MAVDRFVRRDLPSGRDIVLGLADDYAVGLVDANYELPPEAVSKTVLRCSTIRRHTQGHDLG